MLLVERFRTKTKSWVPMVSWDVVCRPTKAGGLGILEALKMNMTLSKKIGGLTHEPREDLVTQVLKELYGQGLNQERYIAHIRGRLPI